MLLGGGICKSRRGCEGEGESSSVCRERVRNYLTGGFKLIHRAMLNKTFEGKGQGLISNLLSSSGAYTSIE